MVGFGVFLPSYGPLPSGARDVLAVARTADTAGLDHVWVGDHFKWNTGMLAPMPTLAAVAAVTERVRLGTGVYLLNLRHPAVVAKDVATVDLISGGRTILGVGAGGDDPAEYAALGIEPARRGVRLAEMVTATRALLAGEGTAAEGELVRHPSFTLEPRPVQRPIPIWLGGRADVVVRRAARIADGWFPVWVSAGRIAAAARQIEDVRGSLAGFTLALNVFVAIGDSREKAARQVADHLYEAYRLPFEKFERYAVYGDADDVIEGLHSYLEAGLTDIAFNLTGPDRLDQTRQIIEGVLPGLGWGRSVEDRCS